MGALETLHPSLHHEINSLFKKLTRKCETLELKQACSQDTKSTDQRIVNLERVNREMKKQLQCYKDELDLVKTVSENFKEFEKYQKLATDFN